MVAFTEESMYGLPSVAYIKGYTAQADGIAQHCNPYRLKTRNYDSWNMGFEDSAGITNYDIHTGSDTQECV